MADGRMLKKKISWSKQVNDLQNDTHRLLFTWIIPHLDIKGRIPGEAHLLMHIVFPRRKDLVAEQIENGLQDIEVVGLGWRYKDQKSRELILQINGFLDNQNLRTEREAKSIFPDPTPDQLLTNSRRSPAQDKLSQVKLSKDNNSKKSPYWAAFTSKTQEILKNVSKDFNIYAFLGRLKKQSKEKVELPQEVVLRVCQSFLDQKGLINDQWAWFVSVIPRISQDIEHEHHKNTPVLPGIREILEEMGNKGCVNVISGQNQRGIRKL